MWCAKHIHRHAEKDPKKTLIKWKQKRQKITRKNNGTATWN